MLPVVIYLYFQTCSIRTFVHLNHCFSAARKKVICLLEKEIYRKDLNKPPLSITFLSGIILNPIPLWWWQTICAAPTLFHLSDLSVCSCCCMLHVCVNVYMTYSWVSQIPIVLCWKKWEGRLVGGSVLGLNNSPLIVQEAVKECDV